MKGNHTGLCKPTGCFNICTSADEQMMGVDDDDNDQENVVHARLEAAYWNHLSTFVTLTQQNGIYKWASK